MNETDSEFSDEIDSSSSHESSSDQEDQPPTSENIQRGKVRGVRTRGEIHSRPPTKGWSE